MAILRHLARKHNLLGRSEEEERMADMTSLEAADLRNEFIRLMFNPNYVSIHIPSAGWKLIDACRTMLWTTSRRVSSPSSHRDCQSLWVKSPGLQGHIWPMRTSTSLTFSTRWGFSTLQPLRCARTWWTNGQIRSIAKNEIPRKALVIFKSESLSIGLIKKELLYISVIVFSYMP